MRRIYICIILFIFIIPRLTAGEKDKGFEIKFSLIHPVLNREDYRFSADPSVEFLYYFPLVNKISLSGGVFAQTGSHNWQVFTGHTFIGDNGFPYPLRTNYSRRLKYFCAGLPLKIEKEFNSSILRSVYLKIAASSYLHVEIADYYKSEYVAEFKTNFDNFFWDLQLGTNSIVYKSNKIQVALSPQIGIRNFDSEHSYLLKYFYYGIGLSTKLGI